MIWLILFSGLLIILTGVTVFQTETSNYMRMQQHLKNVTISVARDAVQYPELIPYGDGFLIFDYDECIECLENNIVKSLNIDSDFAPLPDSPWVHGIVYSATFFDESLNAKTYQNGVPTGNFNFTFPYTYTEPKTGYAFKVDAPGVVVTLDAGKFRFNFTKDEIKLVRSSYYKANER